MSAALGSGNGVDLVDDHVLHAAQNLGCLAREDQIQRLGRRDQDVRRVANEMAPLIRGRVAGPDTDLDLRDGLAQVFGRETDARQRPPQVPLHVVDQCLERRDVQDADGARGRLRGRGFGFPRETVQAPQERGERLATARWRMDQGVASGGDAGPALGLRGRGALEGRPEPLRH